MGQYYEVVNLSKRQTLEKLSGLKLIEFGYLVSDDNLNLVVLLSGDWKGDVVIVVGDYFTEEYFDVSESEYWKSPEKKALYLSYLQELKEYGQHLYSIACSFPTVLPDTEELIMAIDDTVAGCKAFWDFYEERRYFVNYKRKEYVDLVEWIKLYSKRYEPYDLFIKSPVVLLLACGNGLGGGDYRGINLDKVGMWAFDPVGIEKNRPQEGFKEITQDVLFGGRHD